MKSFKLEDIIRSNIQQLVPYASARSQFGGEADVFLDANENSIGSAVGHGYNRYPDPLQWSLKKEIGKLKGIPPEHIFLGNGSDEPIDLLIRATCDPGKDNILLLPPTYGMYEVSARINDVAIREVALTADFGPDVDAVLGAVDAQTRLIFLCSPNNPTGNLFSRGSIEAILTQFGGIVVVDEAYIDFAGGKTWLHSLEDHPNLVILQTFSKAWGLAALRLGMAFASPEIIAVLNKIKPPYNINACTQELALEALGKADTVQEWIRVIKEGKEWLAQQLAGLSFVEKVYPSAANFLLVKVEDATRLYNYLLAQGIVVRNRTTMPGCKDCLRITVGTAAENTTLMDALNHYAA